MFSHPVHRPQVHTERIFAIRLLQGHGEGVACQSQQKERSDSFAGSLVGMPQTSRDAVAVVVVDSGVDGGAVGWQQWQQPRGEAQ